MTPATPFSRFQTFSGRVQSMLVEGRSMVEGRNAFVSNEKLHGNLLRKWPVSTYGYAVRQAASWHTHKSKIPAMLQKKLHHSLASSGE